MDKKKIIWLASYPKSGNTWFRVILSNILSETDNPTDINELVETPIASSRFIFDNLTGTSASDLTVQEINNLRPKVYTLLSDHSDKDLFLKVHDVWQINKLGSPIFPKDITKGVLYFIRNPLDIAASLAFHNSSSILESIKTLNSQSYALCKNPKKLHNQLYQRISNWSKHVRSWTIESGLPIFTIRYEDLHINPLQTIFEALKFINMEVSKKRIIEAIENSSFKKLKEQEISNGFKEKPINATSFFREGKYNTWKYHLNQSDITEIVKAHTTIMRRYGYISKDSDKV
ncbi:MAG: sulfotransferase domain-containing protein [Bacteroidota bacterium]